MAGAILDAEVDVCSGQYCHCAKAQYSDDEMDQLRTLVEHSLECSQEVQINCLGAPLKVSFFFAVFLY